MDGSFAVRAFFIAVISGCLTLRTFAPIKCLDSNCVNAAAALSAAGFATTTVCVAYVVTSAATLCTTRNRQFSFHLLMIRPCWCIHLFHTGRFPDNGRCTKFLLTNAATGEAESSTNQWGRYPVTLPHFTSCVPLWTPGPPVVTRRLSQLGACVLRLPIPP